MLHAPLIYSVFYYFSPVSSAASHRSDYLSNYFAEPLALSMLCSILKFMSRTGARTGLRWTEKISGSKTPGKHAWEIDELGGSNREGRDKTADWTILFLLLSCRKTLKLWVGGWHPNPHHFLFWIFLSLRTWEAWEWSNHAQPF